MARPETIEFVVDTKQVATGVDAANKQIVVFEQTGVRANQSLQTGFDKTGEAAVRTTQRMEGLNGSMQRQMDQALAHQSALQKYSSEMERWAVTTGRAIGNIGHASAHAVEGILALGGAFAGARALMKETTAEVSLLEVAAGKLRNVGRAVETAWAGIRHGAGAAIDVAGGLAAIAAVERIAETAYQRAGQIERQAVQAAKSGLSYGDTAALSFAAERAGRPSDFFDSAAAKFGGAQQLGEQFSKLGAIADPIERASKAFAVFGADAERFLPLLGTRLNENIAQVNNLGLAFDKVDRENLATFKHDVDSLRESFAGVSDSVSAWATSLGNSFAKAFGSVYSTLREGSRQGAALLGLAVTAGAGVTSPNIAFSQTPFDVAGALREQQSQFGVGAGSQAALVQAIQRLAPAGTRLFLGGRGDGEGALQERVSELQKQLFVSDPTAKNFGQLQPAASSGGFEGQALALQQFISGKQRIEQLDAEKQAAKDREKAEQELASTQKTVASALQQAQLSELTGAIKLRAERDIAIAQYGKTKDLIRQINQEFDIYFREDSKRVQDTVTAGRAKALAELQKVAEGLGRREEGPLYTKEGEEFQGALRRQQEGLERSQSITTGTLTSQRRSELSQQESAIRIGGILDIGPNGQLNAELQLIQARKSAADQLYTYELGLAEAQHKYDGELENAQLELREQHARDVFDLESQFAEKLAQKQREQTESIKSRVEPLLTTLFTHPQRFPQQLGTTLRDAALHPIVEGLSSATAGFLQPILHGGNQTLSITAEKPLPVYVINAVGGGTVSLPGIFGTAGPLFTGGTGGGSVPSGSAGFTAGGIPFSALSGVLPLLAGPLSQEGSLGIASSIGPGGTASFAPGPIGFGGTFSGPVAGGSASFGSGAAPSTTGGGYFGGLRGLFSGRTSAQGKPGGFGGLFGAFSNPGSLIGYKGGGEFNTTSSLGAQSGNFSQASGFLGGVQGIAGSPVGGIAGSFLANQGLLGRNQGTVGGIFEGAAGGALIGAGIGGPLGAAVGAAAGFGIGLGELIAGVEPQWREAQRLVKSKYGINIPHSEADKIVSIANSSFGGRVSVAVESPAVRQMLGLYAAGTGQRFPASADQPHAASFLEQGGRLYQDQTYQYGVGSVLSSNLPVAGGYAPQTLPNPSYGSVTLNVNGQSAADLLEGRVANVATPSYIQNQYSASLANSDGRVSNIATLSEPGLLVD